MAKQHFQDLGFGEKAAEASARLLNPDGTFNIRRRGQSLLEAFSSFHFLIGIPWWKFNLLVVLAYIAINALFACLYMAVGLHGLDGVTSKDFVGRFEEAFFFSAQTFTTVGYGHVSPVTFGANALSALESLTGLLSFALATGLLYGRFSRPVARIIFSKKAVVAPYGDGTGFMFRIANERTNQLIEVQMQVVVVLLKDIGGGKKARKFYELDLERKTLNFFHLSWTIVHPIEPGSPLYGMTKQDLDESDAEFLILFKAFDDTFSQSVHTRSSYKYHEVMYEHKFSQIIKTGEDGTTELHLDHIHDVEPVRVPVLQ